MKARRVWYGSKGLVGRRCYETGAKKQRRRVRKDKRERSLRWDFSRGRSRIFTRRKIEALRSPRYLWRASYLSDRLSTPATGKTSIPMSYGNQLTVSTSFPKCHRFFLRPRGARFLPRGERNSCRENESSRFFPPETVSQVRFSLARGNNYFLHFGV